MKRVGVIGYPIKHSISPVFQQAALDECGAPARYERFEVQPADLPSFLCEVRGDDWLGANITIPHKQAALPLVDELRPEVAAIGAVNTVVNHCGSLLGCNTDTGGFVRTLEEHGHSVVGERAVVLGTGGAARAVVAGLLEAGASHVRVFGRSHERAQRLVADRNRWSGTTTTIAAPWEDTELTAALRDAALLVNTTPVGMLGGGAEDKSPAPASALHARLIVFDAVYNPMETPLLRAARSAGAQVVSGLHMLVYQGAESFELWTGIPAPIETMRRSAIDALEGTKTHV